MAEWNVPGFTELRMLGSGNFGEVVLARHDGSGTLVAIKYLRHELLADPGFAGMFRGEAAVLASLDDPNVVRLYEYVESPSGAAIVMGVSLSHPDKPLWPAHGGEPAGSGRRRQPLGVTLGQEGADVGGAQRRQRGQIGLGPQMAGQEAHEIGDIVAVGLHRQRRSPALGPEPRKERLPALVRGHA